MPFYHCDHCDKKFDAPESDTPRCPTCFWTTSVRSLEEAKEQKKEFLGKTTKVNLPKFQLRLPAKKIFQILAISVLIFVSIWFARNQFHQTVQAIKHIRLNFSKKEPVLKTNEKAETTKPNPVSKKADASLLNPAELAILSKQVTLTVPREFSGDESEIFNRRVDFSFQTNQIQKPRVWTLDEFEKFLTKQQKIKGVYFSWGYERKLIQLFKDHYVKAGEAFSKSDYETARFEFLEALIFPVYSDNLLRHRAIALVMLQPYINDVLGKVRTLNSHVLMQRVKDSIQQVQIKYETLFNLIKEKDIEKAFQLVESLEKELEFINQSAKQAQVDYPPIINQIDADIKRGINLQDEALAPISTGLNSVGADIRIKKKGLSQNLPGSLRSTQQDYEKALSAIQTKNWNEALSELGKIQFPPELADDARQKETIIRKLVESRT